VIAGLRRADTKSDEFVVRSSREPPIANIVGNRARVFDKGAGQARRIKLCAGSRGMTGSLDAGGGTDPTPLTIQPRYISPGKELRSHASDSPALINSNQPDQATESVQPSSASAEMPKRRRECSRCTRADGLSRNPLI